MRTGTRPAILAACVMAAAAGGVSTAQAEGFTVQGPDGEWTLELRGLVHFDGRLFSGGSADDADDEWLLRRVRPYVQGALGDRIEFRIMPDLGQGDAQIVDAYVDAALGGGLVLRAGKFKPPVGLERLQSSESLRLVERSYVSELLPNRDLGVALTGGGKRLSFSAGVFNGVNDGRSGDEDDDGNQDLALRVFAHPFAGGSGETTFGIGAAATWGSTDGESATPLLSGYRSPGQATVFRYRGGADPTVADGHRLRVSPQFYWYSGPLGLLGEWARVRQDVSRLGAGRSGTLEHEAWAVTAEWLVTGQQAAYREPDEPGAVQLVARVARLDIDEDAFAGGAASFADPAAAVRRADTWGAGVNWRPLKGIKASLAFQHTSYDGGAAGGDLPDERVVFLRLQQAF
jgi:phosphate-selective porin OprO/OprP